MLEYARHMSLLDSVMFGEGFDDGGSTACKNMTSGVCGDAEWMLLATSGLQFGVYNDMLSDANLFRGMVFGMWGRPPYTALAQNQHLWAWLDQSGLAANTTEMLGFWADQTDWHPVVSTNSTAVSATAYLVQPIHTGGVLKRGHLVLAVASWAPENVTFSLSLDTATITSKISDWPAGGTHELVLEVPAIPMVQPGFAAHTLAGLTLAPRQGFLMVVSPGP